MANHDTLFLIPLLPLLGAMILGFFGRRLDKSLITVIALAAVGGSFLITVGATWTLVRIGAPLENTLWSWMAVGRYSIDLALGFDQLTATLMLVVTGVGFLIHLYSAGYMHDDPSYWRYFAYLNLFIFAMSVLALGRSLPVMFIGWEGVGLASYLLIGFWFADEKKATAGKKAFIVNRVGDFGMLLGMFTLLGLFGTVDFVELKSAVLGVGDAGATLNTGMFKGLAVRDVLTFACLSLFLGATGKSAQVPLYIWLPDAMAGPTPVSALIHAATMVTAGVYMLARMSFLFDPALVPVAMNVVATTGAITAVLAATIALTQNDIKKVLAYSTVSQLGYMFLAAGVGAHSAAVFHLVTHAFFKACLFLGSGAVIHALHGEQDMRRMGGLRKRLPWVHGSFLVSTLAIAGIPVFAGFVSKDAILVFTFQAAPTLGWMAVGGAVMTAFYMGRCLSMTFYGELRHPDEHVTGHLHIPDASMRIPLAILGTLAVVGGALNWPHLLPVLPHNVLDSWLAPVIKTAALTMGTQEELALMGGSILLAGGGLGLGIMMYRRGSATLIDSLTGSGPGQWVHGLLMNKWYVDEVYDLVVVRPMRFVGRVISAVIDPWVIDGILVKLIPNIGVKGGGGLLRQPQDGNVQSYAAMFVAAVAVISAWALW